MGVMFPEQDSINYMAWAEIIHGLKLVLTGATHD